MSTEKTKNKITDYAFIALGVVMLILYVSGGYDAIREIGVYFVPFGVGLLIYDYMHPKPAKIP